MDTSNSLSLLEQLDDEIDDLEESLAPIVKAALSETTSKLPLLDKAKLYVLVTYAIESILFSYLRLNGIKAREHPVFKELTRVKQYFEKIKAVENPVAKRGNLSLDKGAAARIIKAGLSRNDKYDLERAEQQAKERARAHIKLGQLSEKMKQDEISKKRKSEAPRPESSNSDSDSDSGSSAEEVKDTPVAAQTPKKKRKVDHSSGSLPVSGDSTPSEKPKEKKRKTKKTKKHRKDEKMK